MRGVCRQTAAMSSGRRSGLPDMEVTPPKTLVIAGRVTPAAVPGLCAALESLLHDSDGTVRIPDGDGVDCDVGGVVHVDLTLAEAVARLALVARRAGVGRLRLRNASPELRGLLALMGLADVVDLVDADGVYDGTGCAGHGPEPGADGT